MNNLIILEGLEIYIFLFLMLALIVFGFIGIVAAIKGDNKLDAIKDELYEQREKNIALNRDNMRLKLKCGELKAGEKVDV